MTETPNDLMTLLDVLEQFKPRRKWWALRIEEGDIVAYRVPGERGIWLSRAEVERLVRPQPLNIIPKPRQEVVKRGDSPTKPKPTEPEKTDE